mgnify:CR=1 FL=1
MGEVSKAVGQWIVGNVGWSVIIILFVLSGIFKVTKRDIDPLGWVINWFGRALTKDVRKDVADLKADTELKFAEVKTDRAAKIEELKSDYNNKIIALQSDLDGFEKATNSSITDMKEGTFANCIMLKARLDEMEKSNDMQTIRQIKAHVLDFANSCYNKRKHTKKDFDNIVKENEEYEELVSKYGMKNDVYTEDFHYIMKVYHKCQDEDSFLKEED